MTVQSSSKLTLRQWTYLWLAVWVAMFVATHIPVHAPAAVRFPYADKIVHFAMFFMLAWLGGRRLRAATGALAGGALIAWAVVYAVYGALDEWLQSFVGRSMTLGDWLADAGGILAGTAFLVLRRRTRTLSEPPPDHEDGVTLR